MTFGACHCAERAKPVSDRAWEVTQRYENHSAFNGYHRTPSAYSSIHCVACNANWRTKAGYVAQLQDRRIE